MVNAMKRLQHILNTVRWVIDMKRSGMTLAEITDFFDWNAALERAVKRSGDHDLRRRCDPCTTDRCKWCTAISRAHVRHYLGTEKPPAPGSSWSTHQHWPDVIAELRLMGFPDAPKCADCERLWAPPRCGCRGSCSPRPAGVAS
jgi:hypothetical protein